MRSVLLVALTLLVPTAAVAAEPTPIAGYSLRTQGNAGDWVVAFLPMPPGETASGYHISVAATVTTPIGTPGALFVTPMAWVALDGSLRYFDHLGSPEVLTLPAGGELRYHEAYSSFASDVQGLLFAFTANGAWTVETDVIYERSGWLLQAPRATGSNATLDFGGAGLPLGGPRELDLTFPEGGWNHVAIAELGLQPDGVREISITFPNGRHVDESGSTTGADGYLIGAWGSDMHSSWGVLDDDAGRLQASLLAVEASAAVDLVGIHIPIQPTQWPVALQFGDYAHANVYGRGLRSTVDQFMPTATDALNDALRIVGPHLWNRGAHAGAGPSRVEGERGECLVEAPASVVLHPSARTSGRWAMEVDQAYGPDPGCNGLSLGYHAWPSYVLENLWGSPSTGLRGAGTAELLGTNAGQVQWEVTVGPVGLETVWSIHSVHDPDLEGFPTTHQWWNGTAVMAGANT